MAKKYFDNMPAADAKALNTSLGVAVNVKHYGAVGDGVADDTIAIQSALAASTNVYFPDGVYLASNLTIINNNTHIHGNGISSIIKMIVGSTGKLIDAGVNQINLEKLALFGGITTSMKGVAIGGGREGLSMRSMQDSRIDNIDISGFDKCGIIFTSTVNTRGTNLTFSNSSLKNNYLAVDISTIDSEYIKFNNLDIHSNYTALKLCSGNFLMSNSKVNDNTTGINLIGGGGNDGHGNISNCLINHNDTPLLADDILANGFTFSGCHFFDGMILIRNCGGITICNGIFDPSSLYINGGTVNVISNNFVPNGYAIFTNITHNYINPDSTLLIDNYLKNGSYLDDNRSQISAAICPEYADNAAAVAGGLKIGKTYRTGDIAKIVHA